MGGARMAEALLSALDGPLRLEAAFLVAGAITLLTAFVKPRGV